jgi:hypothetical protein
MRQDTHGLHHLEIQFANMGVKGSRRSKLWQTARHKWCREYRSTIGHTTGFAELCRIAAELYVLLELSPTERLQRMIYDHTHPGLSRRFMAG